MKVLILHFGMGKTGMRIIDRLFQNHSNDLVDAVQLEPTERHGFYGWLLRSLIPGWKVSVKPVELERHDLHYLVAPKWGHNCPPVNGFVHSHKLADKDFALIVTYAKGEASDYMTRLAKKFSSRGANLLSVLALRRDEITSGKYEQKMAKFFEQVNAERPCK